MSENKHIVVLGTGGTIAGLADSPAAPANYVDSQLEVSNLLFQIQHQLPPGIELSCHQVCQLGSENFSSDIWLKLAKDIARLLNQPHVSGLVLTQGTDTIQETAYFLNLVVRSTKPLIVAGAMRPANSLSADGPLNLYRATLLAASDKAVGQGVLVLLNDRIYAARDVTKSNTSTLDSFQSPDFGCLGYMLSKQPEFYRAATRCHTVTSPFDIESIDCPSLPKVDIVYAYPGAGPEAIHSFAAHGARGLIHAGTGNGTLSMVHRHAYEAVMRQGVVVVRSSRAGSGIVERNAGANDDDLGTVAGDSLNPSKARVLLSLALTKSLHQMTIQEFFEQC